MMLMMGSHLAMHASTSQTNVALSGGESEYCAILKGATHAFGLQPSLYDFGVRHLSPIKLALAPVELRSDSVAAEVLQTAKDWAWSGI
eukprot:521725-Pyramimonas_sp.AAC.1